MTLAFPERAYRTPSVRKYALGFALVLVIQGCWLTAPELLQHYGSYSAAAETAYLRGDLWTDDAIVQLASSGLNEDRAVSDRQKTRPIEASAMRAIRLAPVNAKTWLLLADLNAQSKPQKATRLIKLSFYTGPADDGLIPQYLRLMAHFSLNSDDELQYIMERQVQKVIFRHPELRPLLLEIFQRTSIENQTVIQKLAAQLEPAFGAELARLRR